jgi:CPSF A subunit region
VCHADFHLGETTVNLSSTHCCRSPLLVHSTTPVSTQAALKQQDALFGRQDDDHRVAIHFGTADGSLGLIVAVSEPVFWRLMALQSVMANALECDTGLNPRLWRLY